MGEKYVEIIEDVNVWEIWRPKEIIIKYVADETEAEQFYKDNKDIITKHKARYIDMNHDPDPAKNKPCIARNIIDGKIQAEVK